MGTVFSILAMLALLILGGSAVWQAYTASKYYDEYKNTGNVMKFHGAIFLLLEAIFTIVLIK